MGGLTQEFLNSARLDCGGGSKWDGYLHATNHSQSNALPFLPEGKPVLRSLVANRRYGVKRAHSPPNALLSLPEA